MLVGTFINLAFYEFDPVAMLGHGIGAVALSIGPFGLAALGIAALVGLYVFWWLYRKQSPRMFVLTMAIVSASAGGLFGITAMSVGLAPLLLAVRPEFWREITS